MLSLKKKISATTEGLWALAEGGCTSSLMVPQTQLNLSLQDTFHMPFWCKCLGGYCVSNKESYSFTKH